MTIFLVTNGSVARSAHGIPLHGLYESGLSRETPPIGCVCVCVSVGRRGERKRKRLIFKEFAYSVLEAGTSEVCGARRQAGDPGRRGVCTRQPARRIPSSAGETASD